jgi:hypothetical protein
MARHGICTAQISFFKSEITDASSDLVVFACRAQTVAQEGRWDGGGRMLVRSFCPSTFPTTNLDNCATSSRSCLFSSRSAYISRGSIADRVRAGPR